MNDKLQLHQQSGLQKIPSGATNNIGSIDTFVANANQVQNNYIFGGQGMPGPSTPPNYGVPSKTDTEYYNLFVVSKAAFVTGGFSIPKTEALQDTDKEVVEKLTSLGDQELSYIRSYPSIVAVANRQYGTIAPESFVYYGFINSIQVCDAQIIFGFTKLHDIPQSVFVDYAADFGVGKACACNEFDNPHWAVKHINVVEALRNRGVQVMVISY